LRKDAVEEIILSAPKGTRGAASLSQTHGGFDNDPASMNSVLFRILGGQPKHRFEARDLGY
jgi:hypothetical protein